MRRVSSNDASEVIQLGDWIVLLWSCNASGPAVLPWMKDTMEAFQAVSFFSFITAGIFQEHGGIFFCCQLYLQMALYLSHHHWCHFAMWRIGVKILPWCAERASQGLPKRGTRNKHVGWWKTLCVCYSGSCIYIIVYQRNEKKKKGSLVETWTTKTFLLFIYAITLILHCMLCLAGVRGSFGIVVLRAYQSVWTVRHTVSFRVCLLCW